MLAPIPDAKAAAAVQNPQRETALNLQGMVLAGLDRLDEGLRAFDAARKFGFKGSDEHCWVTPILHLKGKHSAKHRHLFCSNLMSRMQLQSGIVDA